MENLFEEPSQFHIGSWPWFDILKTSKQYIRFTNAEYNALEKVIHKENKYHKGIINSNNLNSQFKYYIGLWLVSDIGLIKVNKSIQVQVTLKVNPKDQSTINFFKNQICISDDEKGEQTLVKCSEFYAYRICPENMELVIT